MRSDPTLASHGLEPEIIGRASRDDRATDPGHHEAETENGPIRRADCMIVNPVTLDTGLHLLVIGSFHQIPFISLEIFFGQHQRSLLMLGK